jgi:hypothetical protein
VNVCVLGQGDRLCGFGRPAGKRVKARSIKVDDVVSHYSRLIGFGVVKAVILSETGNVFLDVEMNAEGERYALLEDECVYHSCTL